jgi:hypothetical protein
VRKKQGNETKGTLMKEAESIIDELLAWEAEVEKPNLDQIEEVVLELRERLSQKMAQSVIEAQEEVKPVPGPECEQCGAEMRYKGQKSKRVKSWVGQLELERGYYYCERCGVGDFPPGPAT